MTQAAKLLYTARTHTDEGACSLGARLAASLPCVDREIARGIIDEAHQTCLYSRALRRNIDVKVALV